MKTYEQISQAPVETREDVSNALIYCNGALEALRHAEKHGIKAARDGVKAMLGAYSDKANEHAAETTRQIERLADNAEDTMQQIVRLAGARR